MKSINFFSSVFVIFFILFNVPVSFSQAKEPETVKFDTVSTGLKFPEGPAWDGKGSLYHSNCYGGFISKITGNQVSVFVQASEKPFTINKTNGLTFYKDGSLFACEFGEGKILRITPDAKTEIYADGYNGNKFSKPNDLAFAPNGDLYFTDTKSYDRKNPDGVVYMIDRKTRAVKLAADSLAFPNGIAFSADGKHVYVCESVFNRVLKFKVSKDGTLGQREVFIELPGGDPDGIAFDKAGNLYVAHFGGSKIAVVNPKGKIIREIKTPGKKPSNVEFAGKDMKTLYITEDETNSVYKIRVDVPGIKLFCAP